MSAQSPRKLDTLGRVDTVRRLRMPDQTVYPAAAVGAALLVFELYLLARWVFGSEFTPIPSGVTPVPTWMKLGMIIGQIVLLVVIVALVYRLLIKHWREERTLTLYGLMVPVLLLTSVYDPAGSYFHNWYSYNSYFVNFGSAMYYIPGWRGFHAAGAGIPWPVIFIPSVYVIVFIGMMWLGSRLMSAISRRWPNTPNAVLVTATFAAIVVFDIIIEGMIMMRLGWYAETGLSLFAGHYYQMPWRNLLLAALMWTALAAFGHFRNDRGQTIVERGAEHLPPTSIKKAVLRFLAMLAATQIILVVFYQIPIALYEHNHNGHWPADIQDRSYLNGHMCGVGTPRTCP
jgi:Spirocyclase AveC-like